MEKQDDITLLNLIASDNEKALRVIYEKYFPLVYSFMKRECKSIEDSKDLAQDVFLKLWRSRHSLSRIDSLKNYLFIISRNTFIDYVRKKINQRVFEELTSSTIEHSTIDVDDSQVLIEQLIKYSEKMPEKRLEVFKLRWLEGKSRKEIAEQMGISIVTVDIHIRKALEFLRHKVQENKLLIILLLFI